MIEPSNHTSANTCPSAADLIRVEDDGCVTGLHSRHSDFEAVARLVANRTVPQLSVRAWTETVDGKSVGVLEVPRLLNLVATSDGILLRRRLKMDGSPESVPLYPHEIVQRQSSLGRLDPSAMPIPDVSEGDLDPIQRIRIRQAIQKYGGDKSLLPLPDEELDRALGFVKDVEGVGRPTLAGLLFLGTPTLLRDNVPAYEVAFQVDGCPGERILPEAASGDLRGGGNSVQGLGRRRGDADRSVPHGDSEL